MEGLRHAELRQGPASSGRARGARHLAGALPRRAGRGSRLSLLGRERFDEAARIALGDGATAATTPAERADGVARALEEFPASVEAAGYIETTANEVFIAGSTGQRAYATSTQAGCSVMAIAENSSGFAESVERKLSNLDVPALAERAVRKAELGPDPKPVEPGAYTVILEPAATSTLLQFLAFLGFGGKAFLEGRSFMTGKAGEQ